MSLIFFIDESGSQDWSNEEFYTISACVINSTDKEYLEQMINKFKEKFTSKFGQKIPYLHGSEITFGLNKGKGLFSMLNYDENIRNDFFTELNTILGVKKYEIISISLDLESFINYLKDKLDAHYSSKGEIFYLTKFFNNIIYPQCLLILSEQIRLYLNSKKIDKPEKVSFRIENINSNFQIMKKRISNRFSDVNLEIIDMVKKGSKDYSPIFEIVDLSANAINQKNKTEVKRQDFSSIVDNIVTNKIITKENFVEYFTFKF